MRAKHLLGNPHASGIQTWLHLHSTRHSGFNAPVAERRGEIGNEDGQESSSCLLGGLDPLGNSSGRFLIFLVDTICLRSTMFSGIW